MEREGPETFSPELLKEEILELKAQMTAEEKAFGENIVKQKEQKERVAMDVKVWRESEKMAQDTFLLVTPEMANGQSVMIHIKHKGQTLYECWKRSWAGYSDGKTRSQSAVNEFDLS